MSFIALIDYGMGNLLSVSKALEHSGASIRIVDRPEDADGASGLILPGVGNFGDGMEHLEQRGFSSVVKKWIAGDKPFLGICLGMQMLLEESEEAPGVKGLGVFKGKVVKFPKCGEKVPHMGWNSIDVKAKSCAFLDGVPEGAFMYFVHSFYAAPDDSGIVAASCDYIHVFAAALWRGNSFATQFHPEKSQERGLQILRNFTRLCKDTEGRGC